MQSNDTARKRAAERFPAKTEVTDTGCLLWTGTVMSNGYGNVWNGHNAMPAHRFAWEIASDDILTREDVIGHICDVPRCVQTGGQGTYEVDGVLLPRFGHLFKGRGVHNSRDAASKGRMAFGDRHGSRSHPDQFRGLKTPIVGEHNAQAKLTNDAVRSILELGANGVPHGDIATQFGVTAPTIWKIVHRRAWKHVD